MKIIVVGFNSMLGKQLSMKLAEKHIVIKAGRDLSADIYLDLGAISHAYDYTEDVDAIVHCAASFDDNHILSAIKNEAVNSLGPLQVARLAEQTRCSHLIYISTISTYDVPRNEYFGSYGLSKRHAQENLALICGQLGIYYTALLPSALYDERGEARKHQKLFYHMLDLASKGKDISIYGSADPIRNFLFIEDFVNIIEQILCKKIVGNYPCVHPKSYRLSEIAEIAFNTFGQGGRVIFLPEKANQLGIFVPDDYSIYQLLNYNPRVDLPQGIEKIKANMYS